MLNIAVNHPEQHFLLRAVHGFDDELFVIREKEEAAACTCSFSCLENSMPIAVDVQRSQQLLGSYSIHFQYFLKLLFFVTYYLELNEQLPCLVVAFIGCFIVNALFPFDGFCSFHSLVFGEEYSLAGVKPLSCPFI